MDFAEFVAGLERVRRERGTGAAGAAPAAPGTGVPPDNLVVLASAGSTNEIARGVAADLESEGLDLAPMLVLAFEQTAGRGRQGRSWSSPRGRGVYATLARLYAEPALLPALPLLVGVGLCRALGPHLPGGCRLKWPNDLMVSAAPAGGPGAGSGRKIGGILIEALVHPGDGCVAIIGFGVNHSHRRDELPPGATSLWLERGGGGEGGGAGEPGTAAAASEASAASAGIGGAAGARPGGGRGAPGSGGSGAAADETGVGLAELTWDLVGGVERELAHVDDLPYAVEAYRALSIHRPGDRLVCRTGEREVAGTFLGFDDQGRLRLRPEPPEQSEQGAGEAAGAEGDRGGELVIAAGEVIES